jgi:hypothetical protein
MEPDYVKLKEIKPALSEKHRSCLKKILFPTIRQFMT